MSSTPEKPDTKSRLLNAALLIIRTKGYSATRVDDICAEASVTKGAFFHHFNSKEDLAIAAAEYWSVITDALFEAASYHAAKDPLDRLLGYLAYRKELLQGAVPDFTCLVGTMIQESYETHPAIRAACALSISNHAEKLEQDIAAAINLYGIKANWTAGSLAMHTQAVLQGAFILAKAKGSAAIAAESIDHLIRYVSLLFGREPDIGMLEPESA